MGAAGRKPPLLRGSAHSQTADEEALGYHRTERLPLYPELAIPRDGFRCNDVYIRMGRASCSIVNPGGAASSSTAGATVDTLRRWSCKVTLTQLVEVKREEQLSASACQPEGALSHPTSPEVRIQPVKRRPQ